MKALETNSPIYYHLEQIHSVVLSHLSIAPQTLVYKAAHHHVILHLLNII